MTVTPQTIFVAAITGAFGAKGEIKIKSFTDDPAACLAYAPFVDEQGQVILKINKWREVKGGFAVRSPGIQYRDQAEALRGTKLYCLRDKMPVTDDDEFYHSDLVGLKVKSAENQALGKIEAVHNFGASDLLEIYDTPDVKGTWVLPFTLMHVPKIDIAAGTVVVADWQDYLPEEKQDKKPGKKND
ncbi:MAG: 16S rRNA processing protein RimM [Robiginitomaculum sp.]|nr:16S rRNA processing protein RimM [Robiginitomaculum sp.]MBL4616551.1 16S rRNA processing protein RimM [Robiginitomaculum sp.]